MLNQIQLYTTMLITYYEIRLKNKLYMPRNIIIQTALKEIRIQSKRAKMLINVERKLTIK